MKRKNNTNTMIVPKFTPGDFLSLDGPGQMGSRVISSGANDHEFRSSSEDALREAGEYWKLAGECVE
jgi:hypothetical protein